MTREELIQALKDAIRPSTEQLKLWTDEEVKIPCSVCRSCPKMLVELDYSQRPGTASIELYFFADEDRSPLHSQIAYITLDETEELDIATGAEPPAAWLKAVRATLRENGDALRYWNPIKLTDETMPPIPLDMWCEGKCPLVLERVVLEGLGSHVAEVAP